MFSPRHIIFNEILYTKILGNKHRNQISLLRQKHHKTRNPGLPSTSEYVPIFYHKNAEKAIKM